MAPRSERGGRDGSPGGCSRPSGRAAPTPDFTIKGKGTGGRKAEPSQCSAEGGGEGHQGRRHKGDEDLSRIARSVGPMPRWPPPRYRIQVEFAAPLPFVSDGAPIIARRMGARRRDLRAASPPTGPSRDPLRGPVVGEGWVAMAENPGHATASGSVARGFHRKRPGRADRLQADRAPRSANSARPRDAAATDVSPPKATFTERARGRDPRALGSLCAGTESRLPSIGCRPSANPAGGSVSRPLGSRGASRPGNLGRDQTNSRGVLEGLLLPCSTFTEPGAVSPPRGVPPEPGRRGPRAARAVPRRSSPR